MFIKQYRKFIFKLNDIYSMKQRFEYPISYIEIFLDSAFSNIYREGINNFFTAFYSESNEEGVPYEMVNLNVDHKKNIVYLNEPYDDYIKKATTPELRKIYNSTPEFELCNLNLIDHATMTKDNLVHLVHAWKNCWQNESPFILLYQDDKDWYDILPFDTKEAMEQFVTDHTK